MGFKIFISYSTADSKRFQVEKFATDLQAYSNIDEVLIWEKDSNDNIIGYIRKKYNQKDWKFYGSLTNLTYPIHLKNLIKSRLANLI